MPLKALCPGCGDFLPEPYIDQSWPPWHIVCGHCGRLWKVDLKIEEVSVRGNGMTTYLVQKASGRIR